MSIHKIVITGGPCAGKTTGLSYIEREFTKLGYKVVFINESATELIMNGLHPTAYNEDNYLFEKNIVKLQLAKEAIYMEACKKLPNDKILLVCDRGVMDCKTYMTEQEFERVKKEINLSTVELRDNYDAVFHLLTTAKDVPEYYSKANNLARRENLQEAIINDDTTINVWTGHPHLRIIDNSTNFEGKMKRLIQEICFFLGEPKAVEVERKFLIEMPDVKMLERLPNCNSLEIVQTYLISNNNAETRIRKRGKNGHYIYTLTTKEPLDNGERFEHERRIGYREYCESLNKADLAVKEIIKTRYCLVENNKYFEIDVYPFAKNTAICEIELLNLNEEFKFPSFIKVIKEVTNQKEFSNYSFSKEIPQDMK